jgi:hypothetical protein
LRGQQGVSTAGMPKVATADTGSHDELFDMPEVAERMG